VRMFCANLENSPIRQEDPLVPTRVQIVMDCADPNSLIGFWASALGYEVEFPTGSEQERELLAAHPELEGTAAAAHDPDGVRPRLFLQRVPERKTVKNRVHMDLHVPDLTAEIERLQGLGAKVLHAHLVGNFGEHWTVMADPEGNEFCVAQALENPA
jgi:predicted enzyme related to lactoylglutathione lyase